MTTDKQANPEDAVVISMTVRDCYVTVTLYPEGQIKMDSNIVTQDLPQTLSDMADFSQEAARSLKEKLATDQPHTVQ